jgi:hypothetical protein
LSWEEIRLEGINMMVMGTVVATGVMEVVVGVVLVVGGVVEACALVVIGEDV